MQNVWTEVLSSEIFISIFIQSHFKVEGLQSEMFRISFIITTRLSKSQKKKQPNYRFPYL